MKKYRSIRIATLVLLFAFLVIAKTITNDGAGIEYIRIIGFMGIAVLVWCGVTLKVITGKYLSLIFMYEIAYYVLLLGQSFLYAFNAMPHTTLDLYVSEPVRDVNKAYLFTILCFIGMHYGILWAFHKTKRQIRLEHKRSLSTPIDYTQSMKNLGLFLVPITAVCYLATWSQIIGTFQEVGYADAFASTSGSTSWSKIFDMIGYFFPYVLFMQVVAYKNNKIPRRFFMCLVLAIIIMNLSVGNRSEPISYLMVLLWLINKNVKSKSQKRLSSILMFLGGFLFVLIIPIIGQMRNSGGLTVSAVVDSVASEGITASATQTMVNMGWSAFPMVKMMQLIPYAFNYHYGQSYFFGLLGIFPNIFGGTHIAVKYAGMAGWLMRTLDMSFGPGFSAPAEAYYNFGWFGIIALVVIGYIIAKFLNENRDDLGNLGTFAQVAAFIVLFSFPRRDVLTISRGLAFYVGLLSLAVVVFYSMNKERR